MTVYCQNCGTDTADKPLTFYGNVICSEACKKDLSERVYFRDTPPEAGSLWSCPHCGQQNPLGDPRKNLRPSCASCGKTLDPASATPPKKGGCLGALLLALVPAGLLVFASAGPAGALGSLPRPARAPQDTGRPGAATAAPAELIAVGPVDAVPRRGPYLHGARFEPPYGRVLHGMGQWYDGNVAYRRMLGDAALLPAAKLFFIPVGDWPRSWESRHATLCKLLADTVAEGVIPNIDISLYGLDAQGVEREAVDRAIAEGDRYDGRLLDLVHAIGELGGPVFVRIGAEFNGDWNGYEPGAYPRAFRKIVGMFRAQGVENVAFVWCYEPSAPGDFGARDDDGGWRWYPGDDVVDWFALDLFDVAQFSGSTGRGGVLSPAGRTEAFLRMALEHGKPVMLAECSAARVDITSDGADGRRDWAGFFGPLFAFLDRNPNVMALHYINVDWGTTGDYAQLGWSNARIDRNESIATRYREQLARARFLHLGDVGLLNGYAAPPAAARPVGAQWSDG
jgi:hypothetical protein